MQDIDTVDKKIILLDELESNRLNIPLPQVNGYKWGWIRFALGGYTSNVTPEKDDKHLKSAVENGWMPCVKSPHPGLPLNKAGYVTAGDLVLCLKKVDDTVLQCEYLEREQKMIEEEGLPENLPIAGIARFDEDKIDRELSKHELYREVKLRNGGFGEWYIKCLRDNCDGRLLRKDTNLEKMIVIEKCSKCGNETEFAVQKRPELIE